MSIGPMLSLASRSECIVTAGVVVDLVAAMAGPHAPSKTTDSSQAPGIFWRRPHTRTMERYGARLPKRRRPAPRAGLRSVYERLANGGDGRDLVLHDLVKLRLRLAR